MSKAQRIFDETYYATIKHIESWGYDDETDGGWCGGWYTQTKENPDGELVYQRTQNAIVAILKRRMTSLQYNIKHNIGTPERNELLAKVFCMMAKTAKNQYIAGKCLKE